MDKKELAKTEKKEMTVEQIESIKQGLRIAREDEYRILDRGLFWYEELAEGQKKELREYRQKLKDVTKTLTFPERPEWLT
ncbi:MAG: phage tail assembly chaperone [Firmicutes bacterium]|nr:phage tail assembly chaperone [Bacillota bacterium]